MATYKQLIEEKAGLNLGGDQTSIVATMSATDSTGSAGAVYTFTLAGGHGLTASNIGDQVELSGFTQLTALNGVVTQLATLSTNAVTLEGVISTGTQETSTGASFTFKSTFPDDTRAGVYLAEAYKDVVNKVAASSPDLLSLFGKNIDSGWTNNTYKLENHYIFGVFRKGTVAPANVFKRCRQIPSAQKHSVSDELSIYEATEMDPVYFIEDRQLTVIPGAASIIANMSSTNSSGAAGSLYTFTLNSDHGLTSSNIGDSVLLSGFTQLTDLNGLTTQLKSLATNAITLEGVISTSTQETSETASFEFTTAGTGQFEFLGVGSPDTLSVGYAYPNELISNGSVIMPQDFCIYLVLYVAIKLVEVKLSKMNSGLSTMIDETNKGMLPNLTGDTATAQNGWEAIRYYIQDEEDVELAGAKLQELNAEQQQWTLEYQWFQERLARLKSEYLEPFASAAASEAS